MITDKSGVKTWKKYLENSSHIKNIQDGEIYVYFESGKIHREDGPAIIFKNGKIEYWLDDVKYSENEYNNIISVKKKFEILKKI